MSTIRKAALPASVLACAFWIPSASVADDVTIIPAPAGSSFVVTDSAGSTTKFQVNDDGVSTPGLSGPAAGDPVCSQQGNNGLLVKCDAGSLGGVTLSNNMNCVDIASGTWSPTQSKSVTASCPAGGTPTGGGCSISNLDSWTYIVSRQTKSMSDGNAWTCEWVMPPTLGYGGVIVIGTTTICAAVHCAQ